MERYISHNRINTSIPMINESSEIKPIIQPPSPGVKIIPERIIREQIVQPPPPKEHHNQTNTTELDTTVAEAATWVYAHRWTVIPEITTVPNKDCVSDMAVVVGYSGANAERYAANARALARILHANPKPKYFIFVEFVNPGETSHYSNFENEGWDKVIVVDTTEKGKNVWQKEAIWTVGGKYAFNLPGITKCVFLDADTAWHDNSWCYYINIELQKIGIVQAFEGFYYAEQSDYSDYMYGKRHVAVSTAWAAAHGEKTGVPGGAYACTKEFFNKVLGGAWPCSSRGSGDAVLWLFLKGITNTIDFPMSSDFRLSDIHGAMPNHNIGYAPLLAFHYYHGPLSNRMYGSRDYILRKANTYPGSDVQLSNSGSLEWTDTYEGRFMNKATQILFELNKKVQVSHRPVLVPEIKLATRELRKDIYGHIDGNYPLYVVTYADETVSNDTIRLLQQSLVKYCTTPYTFIVFTNRDIPGIQNCNCFTMPTSKCTSLWHHLLVFGYKYESNTSVLFIDPTTLIHRSFVINQCPDGYIYMARPMVLSKSFGLSNWDSRLMFFRNIKGLYERYQNDVAAGKDRNPEYQFMNPADYINAYAHFNGYTCRNIIGQLDYSYEKQSCYESLLKVSEFVLKEI